MRRKPHTTEKVVPPVMLGRESRTVVDLFLLLVLLLLAIGAIRARDLVADLFLSAGTQQDVGQASRKLAFCRPSS